MNVIPLLKAKEAIKEYPGKFNILTWDCGTTACIAGYVVRLSGGKEAGESICDKARRILKLSTEESYRLFYPDKWPSQFLSKSQYMDRGCNTCTAAQACDRIDHFIKTEGRE